MALDARSRSSIYQKFVPVLGEHDANVLMSEFPTLEGDAVVTRAFLRAELKHEMTLRCGGALALSTSLLAAIGLFA